ncbi:FxsB family cyclophane-forming radical SAM/SPASM peptide maturase [Streptomyces sp. NBC_00620]|uniref:FxsB family cyclophane-forming radical SAM/SPASM peptide maturase n=1 Tax=Streptomyces sp. NBC_00620 TaxID=2903666 RepID=UPI002254FE2B|nr:FxsB family cyclophane-forming radical SAM/SPASM peptide maturase [Streptomyces sp. NBC_00620]MCX4973362.1 FxsB family radical SAM/SPASM domain protein [Streptomyces sp. NBC_00620]
MSGPLVPFRQLVLKVHSRCDLACDHCYVYEHADQSWTARPKAISDEVTSWTALRLAEHAKDHALPSVQVILHGGEPLLAGPERLRRVCEELRKALREVSELDLRIHTNGVQLSERYLDLFVEYGVRVGISLDGDKAANDLHRRFTNRRSSHDKVLTAVSLLRQERYRHLFAGLLCTIDLRNDPVAAYDALAALEPPRIDFLLPHATWDQPPPRPDGTPAAYADWLMAVYDRWEAQGRPVSVRLFDSVISTLGGGPSLTESMGLAPADVVVVETDGTFEQADSLKTAYDGAPVTGEDVFHHTLDDVARHPGITARQQGLAGLSEQCRSCPVVRSCGGGLFAHRYRGDDGSEFDNPSVYCADLEALVRSIDGRTGAGAYRPVEGFDALADGTDDGSAVRELAQARQAVTRELLTLVDQELGEQGGELWEHSWQLALELGRRDGAALTPMLAHPYTRTWVVRCLEEPGPNAALYAHLASLVASAALRCGATDYRVKAPVVDGFAYLQGLGRLRIDEASDEIAELTPRQVSRGAPGWEPVRWLRADGLEVALDDLDPYRDSFDRPASARLTDEETEQWRHVLARAWTLIRKTLPGVAAGMAAGVHIVTPLAGPPDRAPVPEATQSGFAALGIALDPDPTWLAVSLVRRFRLGVLDALLDVCDLYDEADVRTGVLLADTYALMATNALWSQPAPARRVRSHIEELADRGALTLLGRRFVEGMRRGG